MIDLNKKLILKQMDRKLRKLSVLESFEISPKGWIKTIRSVMNISLVQLARRMKRASPSVIEMEQREISKGITLKKMAEVAEALDCRFVYGFIPKEGSLKKTIEKRAYQAAKEIVLRTSHSMKLEDQENSDERIKKAIKSRAKNLKNEMPKYLWD